MVDRYGVIAVVCSAGGVRALQSLLQELPESLAAPILLALHRGEAACGTLIGALRKNASLKVRQAGEAERPAPGVLYVAPGGRHLQVEAGPRLSVRQSGRINYVCPSGDLLLESVAAHYGERALAVVLTGRGRDGAAGAIAVRRAGGFVMVQDPASSEHPAMPASAIETRKVDLVLPLSRIAFALQTLTRGAVAA